MVVQLMNGLFKLLQKGAGGNQELTRVTEADCRGLMNI